MALWSLAVCKRHEPAFARLPQQEGHTCTSNTRSKIWKFVQCIAMLQIYLRYLVFLYLLEHHAAPKHCVEGEVDLGRWVGRLFIGPRCPWGPISVSKLPLANLTDVTLADQATNSIQTDDTNRAIQGNVAMWLNLAARFVINASGAIWTRFWWPNFRPIHVVPLKTILKNSSWKIYSS